MKFFFAFFLQFVFKCVKIAPVPWKQNLAFSLSRSGFGDIAQLVEQMTFNHWVQGSSPCVPTKNSTTACRSFYFCNGARTRTQRKTKNAPVWGDFYWSTMLTHERCFVRRPIFPLRALAFLLGSFVGSVPVPPIVRVPRAIQKCFLLSWHAVLCRIRTPAFLPMFVHLLLRA